MAYDPLANISRERGKFEFLFESTSYRLNEQICPYCLAKKGERIELCGALGFIQCPSCGLSFDFFDPVGDMQIFGLKGFRPIQQELIHCKRSGYFENTLLVPRPINSVSYIGNQTSIYKSCF